MSSVTLDTLVPPVTEAELADFARLDVDDPTLLGLLIMATSTAIAYLKRDLITRAYILTIRNFFDEKESRFISRNNVPGSLDVVLPMANLDWVDSVFIDGIETDDYIIIKGKQSKLRLGHYPTSLSDSIPNIIVNYNAGFGDLSSDVPVEIKQAILMLATYISMHRGCNVTDALSASGAKQLLGPHAVNGGFVI